MPSLNDLFIPAGNSSGASSTTISQRNAPLPDRKPQRVPKVSLSNLANVVVIPTQFQIRFTIRMSSVCDQNDGLCGYALYKQFVFVSPIHGYV